MRPRVFPAEDLVDKWDGYEDDPASMRPRVFPAEDLPLQNMEVSRAEASMRPRVFPAEDIATAMRTHRRSRALQ